MLRAILSSLLLLGACTSSSPSTPVPVTPPAAAPRTSAPTAEALPGVILSRESRIVSAEIDGTLSKLVVEHGQRVTAGTTLAIIDDTEVRKQLDAARGAEDGAAGELRSSQTARAEAARQYRQQRALLKDGAVSRDAVSAARSALAMADAQVATARGVVRRARASREQIEQMLTKTTVTAPIDGVITLVKVAEGQLAMRGQPIARVFDPEDLWVRFAVTPEQRDRVAVGDELAITPVRGGTPLVATVRTIHRTLEPPLQLAVVEADLADSELADHDALLGGMVDVRLMR